MKKSHREDTVGPWAKEKLDALEKYLRFYCTVLKNSQFTLVYVDGFAGAPVTMVRSSGDNSEAMPLLRDSDPDLDELIFGSPVRALSVTPGFHRHYFFDLDPRRAQALEEVKANWPEKWIHVSVGDANERIRKLMAQIGDRREVRGVAFLDPYKENLEWATVEALAASHRFEVFINVPIHMAVNRMLAKGTERKPDWEARVDRWFGTTEWREIVYPECRDLFGNVEAKKADGVPEKLLDLYMERLRGAFSCVSSPRLIRNTKNSPLYYLVWAGPHSKGLQGADYVLGHGEKLAKKRR